MTVEYSVADGVATIALNRPEVRNALNLEMCDALLAVTRRIIEEAARVVFVRGNGPVFCGGADLKERQGMSNEDVRVQDGLETGVTSDDTVVILPAMAGGASVP